MSIADDPGVRVRAAQRGAPQHVVGPQVGGERELAGDLQRAVRPARARRRRRRPPATAVRHGRSSSRLPHQRRGAPAGCRGSALGRRRCAARRARRPARRRPAAAPAAAAAPKHQRGHRVGDAGVAEAVQPPQREVGELARLERADLVVPAEAPRRRRWCPATAPRGRSARSGRRAAGPRSSAWRSSSAELRRPRCEAAPSTPRPTGAPASSRSRTRAMPAPSRALELGQCATPVPVAPSRPIAASSRWTRVRQPHVVAEPAEPLGVLDRRAAELARGRTPPRRRSRRGGCAAARPCAGPARPPRVISSRRDRERRARRDRDPQHRVRRRVVVAVDRLLGRGQRGVGVLDDVVRRQAAVATGPRSIEPRVGWNRRPIRARPPRPARPNRSPPSRGKT